MEIEENFVVTASFIQPTEFIKMGRDPIEIERVYREYEERFVSQSQLIDTLKARIEELEIESIIKDQDIKKLRNEFNDFKKDIKSLLSTVMQDNKRNTLTTNEKDLRTSELNHQFNEVFNMDICGDPSSETSYEQKDCKTFCYDSEEFFISSPTKCSENNYGGYVQHEHEHDQKETNQKIHDKVERTLDKLKIEPEKINQNLFKGSRGNFNEKSNFFSDDSKQFIKFSINEGLAKTKEFSDNVYSGITTFTGFQNTSSSINKCGLKRNFAEIDFSIKNKKIRLSSN